MNSELATTIINQLIGAVIGTVVSFIVSWYFYKKADFPSKVMADITDDILLMLIQDRLGIEFTSYEQISKDELPRNSDIPHIKQYWLSEKTIRPGRSLTVLFSVIDTGLNFPVGNPVRGGFELTEKNAFEIIETSSNISFPVKREGHGYYSCQINFPKNASKGQHKIQIRLKDDQGNSNTQFIKVNIES